MTTTRAENDSSSDAALMSLLSEYSEQISFIAKVESYLIPVLALCGMLINFYIARLVVVTSTLHKFTYIMVAYQAVVDGLVVCPLKMFLELSKIVTGQTWYNDHAQLYCTLTVLYNGANITTTSPVLLFLCVERAFLVLQPTRGKQWMDSIGAKLFFAINLGLSVIYTAWLITGSFLGEDDECILKFRYLSISATGVMFFLMFYFVPLAFMVTLYPLIAMRLIKTRSARNYIINKRISKLLALSTITFAISWAPLMFNSIWVIIDEESWSTVMRNHVLLFYVYALCSVFMIGYSAVNPCIYIMLTRPIREPIVSTVSRGKDELLQMSLIPQRRNSKNVALGGVDAAAALTASTSKGNQLRVPNGIEQQGHLHIQLQSTSAITNTNIITEFSENKC